MTATTTATLTIITTQQPQHQALPQPPGIMATLQLLRQLLLRLQGRTPQPLHPPPPRLLERTPLRLQLLPLQRPTAGQQLRLLLLRQHPERVQPPLRQLPLLHLGEGQQPL